MDLNEVEQNVMGELKDFQKATVERIDYLFRKGQNRVLVSDEVGLGKTLVARGTIAKFAKLRQEEGDDLVKVVYICSNSAIAEQNLEKLKIVNEITTESADTSRLSMQHLNIFMQEHDDTYLKNYIQLIPLTPKTSFNVTNSQGIMSERALMYVILSKIPQIKQYNRRLSSLLSLDVKDWRYLVKLYRGKVNECNKKSDGEYLNYMVSEVKKYLKNTIYYEKSLMEYLCDICKRPKKPDFKEIKDLIVQLRIVFSDVSLDRLSPDLIIMDEFQRFKNLLNGSNEDLNHLSSKFFSLDDMRILMLSATPYKMYSTLDEIDESNTDVHYSEFFEVMDFLNICDKQRDKFIEIWNNYSFELKEFNKNKSSFILAKNKAENAMFRNVCRTERITETKVANFMDDLNISLDVSKEDIISYIEAQNLINDIGLNLSVPIDYIKSTPYIMSFMKQYKLKKRVEDYFKKHPDEINKMNERTFWLNRDVIDDYNVIPFNNARLNYLMNHVLDDDFEKLLWIPPSMPYYEPGGVFKNKIGFSKTLIFSSWEMVPRMISSLVSYEVERKTIGQLAGVKNNIRYFAGDNRYPSQRIRIAFDNGKPTAMTLFSLIYPSKFLADIYNPILYLNKNLSREEIENKIKAKLKRALSKIPCDGMTRDDSRWYYLAPLLLDKMYSKKFVDSWINEQESTNDNQKKQKGFLRYVYHLKKDFYSYDVYQNLGQMPEDLFDVLCNMVIASPAVCAYRCYKNQSSKEPDELRSQLATKFARKFIGRMNQPESISVIDLIFKSNSEGAYWKNVLEYSKQGNLQAVFDEYVHMLSNNIDKNNENKISIINHKLMQSLDFRTTSYEFDTFDDFKSRIRGDEKESSRLRSHYAVSFTKGKDDENDSNRRKSVRDAFNSPFRPFVLASTSIGQEGLDFHNYCRKIVHWNLPSNPLELEQREGRINRFKCLAIRQNVAKRYGNSQFKSYNIWDSLFKKASDNEKSNVCSDLIPYWGLNDSQDMIKIERIVPMYPFSRDVTRYERLMKILSLYRLTLGQSRQEELLSQIFQGLDENFNLDEIKELFINLSPFYKRDVEDFEIDCGEISEKLDYTNDLENDDFEINDEKDYVEKDSSINDDFWDLTTNSLKYIDKSLIVNVDLTSYWDRLKEKISENNDFEESLLIFNPNIYWIQIPNIYINLVRIEMMINNGFLEVKLYHPPNGSNDNIYGYLFSMKDKIEKEIGFELYWRKRKNTKAWKISLFLPIDINDKDNWQNAIDWHIFFAKRFDEVFSDIIRQYLDEKPLIFNNDLRTQYWLELTKELKNTDFRLFEIPHSYSWYSLILEDIPFLECRIELYCYPQRNQIKTSLIIEKFRNNLFDYLVDYKTLIEKEMGFELNWVKTEKRCNINFVTSFNLKDKDFWPELIKWHLSIASVFKKVFSPKILEFYSSNIKIINNQK